MEWLPLRTLGHVLMKQSYVSALIAMMVKSWEGTRRGHGAGGTSWAEPSSSLPSGVEHHLPQLADLRAAAVVVPDLDGAEPPALRHALLALPGALRHHPVQPAVRLGHGPVPRAAHPHQLHEAAAAGAGAPQLPLPDPGGQGECGTVPALSPPAPGWPRSPPVPTAPAHPHLLDAAAAVR